MHMLYVFVKFIGEGGAVWATGEFRVPTPRALQVGLAVQFAAPPKPSCETLSNPACMFRTKGSTVTI